MKQILGFPFKIGVSIMKVLVAIIDAIIKMIGALFGGKPPAPSKETPDLSAKAGVVEFEFENALKKRALVNKFIQQKCRLLSASICQSEIRRQNFNGLIGFVRCAAKLAFNVI